jgi:hypothetical protein
MANFRATIKGSKAEAHRLGSKTSGINATVNGWNLGIEVEGKVNSNGEDTFYVYITGGSKNFTKKGLIGVFAQADLALIVGGH